MGGTKDVNLAKLKRLAPTHVVVNIDENREDAARALADLVPHVIVTHPNAPQDVPVLIDQLAAPFLALPGVAEQAGVLQTELARELLATRGAAVGRRVLYLIWREPWMTVARDTYIERLAGRAWAGARCLHSMAASVARARYPRVAFDEAWLADVDEVLLSSEPYAFTAEHCALAQALCPKARVRLVDGRAAVLAWREHAHRACATCALS